MITEIVEFVEFEQRQLGGAWSTIDRITGADLPVTDGAQTFRTVAVGREPISSSPNDEREELALVLPASDAVADLFKPRAPDQPIRVTIKRATSITRATDSITADTYSTVYIGIIGGAKFSGPVCELRLRPSSRMLDQIGPRQRYSYSCRWDLYGPGCGLNSADYEETGTAIVTTDPSPANYEDYIFATVFSTLDNGYLNGGTLVLRGQWARQIANHSNTATVGPEAWVTIVAPFPVEVEHGDALRAYPGCNHSADVSTGHCANRFANQANFGGFRAVPRANPFHRDLNRGPA